MVFLPMDIKINFISDVLTLLIFTTTLPFFESACFDIIMLFWNMALKDAFFFFTEVSLIIHMILHWFQVYNTVAQQLPTSSNPHPHQCSHYLSAKGDVTEPLKDAVFSSRKRDWPSLYFNSTCMYTTHPGLLRIVLVYACCPGRITKS